MGQRRGVQRKPPTGRKSKYLMINVTLSHELDEFLQRVGNQARKTGGFKLPKTMLLRGLARVLRELVDSDMVDVSGIMTEDQFVSALREAVGLKKKDS